MCKEKKTGKRIGNSLTLSPSCTMPASATSHFSDCMVAKQLLQDLHITMENMGKQITTPVCDIVAHKLHLSVPL